MSILSIVDLKKSFPADHGGSLRVLDGISFDVEPGEFLVVIGPSGCGKTTFLDILSGLESSFDGTVKLSVDQTQLGYVFQRDALLPWKTVRAHLALPLELRKVPEQTAGQTITRWLKTLALEEFADHYPHQLSQGMRRKLALGMTLITEPKLVLMDEPFSAVDAQTRLHLQEELLRLHQELGATVIFVTHDLMEAIFLAKRIVVLSGRPASVKREISFDGQRSASFLDELQKPDFYKLYCELWNALT